MKREYGLAWQVWGLYLPPSALRASMPSVCLVGTTNPWSLYEVIYQSHMIKFFSEMIRLWLRSIDKKMEVPWFNIWHLELNWDFAVRTEPYELWWGPSIGIWHLVDFRDALFRLLWLFGTSLDTGCFTTCFVYSTSICVLILSRWGIINWVFFFFSFFFLSTSITHAHLFGMMCVNLVWSRCTGIDLDKRELVLWSRVFFFFTLITHTHPPLRKEWVQGK